MSCLTYGDKQGPSRYTIKYNGWYTTKSQEMYVNAVSSQVENKFVCVDAYKDGLTLIL